MQRVRSRLSSLVALLTLVAAPIAVIAVTAAPAGAVDVTTAAEYLDAFNDPGDVEINVLNDITFSPCPVFASRAGAGTVTVHGNGHTITGCPGTINHSAAGSNLVFDNIVLDGGSLVVSVAGGNVTMTDSQVTSTETGGLLAISVAGGDVQLTGTQVGPLSAPSLQGVSVANGAVALDRSRVGPITADSALGISNASSATLSLIDSQITSIDADTGFSLGAAVDQVSIVRSTIADGAGTTISAPDVQIENSTISNNGGAVLLDVDAGSVVYSDIVENSTEIVNPGAVELPEVPDGAPEGLALATPVMPDVGPAQVPAQLVWDGELSFFGSVVALPQGGVQNCDVVGASVSNGYNFSDDDTCGLTATTDRQNAGDPSLAALGENGGPTPTRLPLTGSPLINVIPLAACQDDGAAGITTDQRGLPRPAESGCEIGSVELQPPPEPLVLEPTFTG